MSKQLRVELRFSVLVHVGEDITEDGPPNREPNAIECVKLVRVAHLGPMVGSPNAAADVLVGMTANSAPVIAERLRHALHGKGL